MKSDPDAKTLNPLCLKCLRSCKQPAANLLVECPRYFPLPFKVDKHRFDQMGLFDGDDKG
jgi:pullulanase/glycogen debranching enzyme